MPEHSERLIAALKRERAGYEQRGLDERVAGVDAELRRLGQDPGDSGAKDDGGPAGRAGKASRQRTASSETGKAGG